jgi:hypothetical protein
MLLFAGQGQFQWTARSGNLRPLTLLYRAVLVVCLLLALWRNRWTYAAFVLLGVIYFPLMQGFQLNPTACEMLPSVGLAMYSLRNYAHIVGFSFFFVLSYIQFRDTSSVRFALAVLATLTLGLLVELSQGISGLGHCRMRDLIPDAAGALLGGVYVRLWSSARQRWLSLGTAR